MNRKDRKDLEELLKEAIDAKDTFINALDNVKLQIENMKEEEDAKYWNLPEGIQESERGEAYQNVVEYLGEAMDLMEELEEVANDNIGEVEEHIQSAIDEEF